MRASLNAYWRQTGISSTGDQFSRYHLSRGDRGAAERAHELRSRRSRLVRRRLLKPNIVLGLLLPDAEKKRNSVPFDPLISVSFYRSPPLQSVVHDEIHEHKNNVIVICLSDKLPVGENELDTVKTSPTFQFSPPDSSVILKFKKWR